MDNIKRFPSEWERIDRIVILDPDGWRYDNKSFDEPIDREEWDARKNQSTIRPNNTNQKKEKTMKRTVMSTSEYYQQAIDILQELDGDTQGKAKMLIEIAKHCPKTLVIIRAKMMNDPQSIDRQHYEAVARVFNGKNKIPCIKEYRRITGAGLKEAKDWVEDHFSFRGF